LGDFLRVAGFYEKFDFRDASTEIIDHCWPMLQHRQSLLTFAAEPATQPHFLRFANAVTNDVSFHMEEAFKFLAAIREVEEGARERARVGSSRA